MNYLAHAYFARGEPSHWFLVGTVLPDLARRIEGSRRLGAGLGGQLPARGMDGAAALRAGIAHHVAMDLLWHAADWFARAEDVAAAIIQASGPDVLPGVRRFFLRHVLVEMSLDHLIARREPAFLERFYAAFTAHPPGAFAGAAGLPTAEGMEELARRLAGFAEHQFVRHYAQLEGIGEGLERVLKRARQPLPKDDSARGLLMLWIDQLAAELDPRLPALDGELGALLYA